MAERNDSKARMTRRAFIQSGALGAAGFTLAAGASSAPAILEKRRPNLLFINCDQLSNQAIASHGCQYVKTPNIDRLAARGVDFTQSYSADPVCCPARSAWVTGRMPSENGVVVNSAPMLDHLPDIGQLFREEGYETVHVGKWHVSGRDVAGSFKVPHGGYPIGEHGDAATARACEGFLRNWSGRQPFFLMAGLLNPHDICFWVKQHDRKSEPRYPAPREELPPLPPNFHFDPREPAFVKKRAREAPGRVAWSENLWRHHIWAYYRHVEMVDGWIGHILDALESSGHADNTIVVFSADHGDGHARHRRISKGSFYDEISGVPMIVSCPGQVAEAIRDEKHLVSGLDLAPTLCDFARVAPPPKTRGHSLRPLLEERSTPWREFVSAQSKVEGRMIRTEQFKYVKYRNDPVEQFFDLKNDPWETKNLAEESRVASVLADHRKLLDEWESTLEPSPASLKPSSVVTRESLRTRRTRGQDTGQDAH
jgi:arylsulfatase A-like enzyme